MPINWTDLKDARELANMTQTELAEAIGVHPKTIRNWERSGVAPQAEYKVRRALRLELLYVEECAIINRLPERTGFESWAANRLREEEIDRERADESEAAQDPEFAEMDATRREWLGEIEQQDYDRRMGIQRTLAPFDDDVLLNEVIRRYRIREDAARRGEPAEPTNVGRRTDVVDLHTVDLSREDLERAPSTAGTAIDPSRGEA